MKRDRDLRGRRLLNTEQFPDLGFDSTDIRVTTGGWRLVGALTRHGVTIQVSATLTTGPTNSGLTIQATTQFDRRDVGITAPRLMIGYATSPGSYQRNP